jgi:parallel beta-helix repeat protein
MFQNNYYGIYLYNSSMNLIYDNLFNSTSDNVYFGTSGANYWNTTLTSGTNIVGGPYIGGNYWGKPDGTGFSDTCSDSDNDGICDSSYTLATDNIDYLPLAKYVGPLPAPSYTEISSCMQITEPGEYRLVNDIIDSTASTCINIQADNVILDCQGHIVDGVDIWHTYGIYISRDMQTATNITIKNCIVRDWDFGIYLNQANNNTLTNIISNSNTDSGIRIFNSSFNTLSNITLGEQGDGNYVGLSLFYSNFNNIANIITKYNVYGVYLLSSNFNTLSNIESNFNLNDGIYFDCSFSNTIKNSIIRDNSRYGIKIYCDWTGEPNYIYNNLLNNTINFYFEGTIYTNYWNTTLQEGNNIWNSSLGYIGGNLWTTPDNNGYSDTCVDANYDGFCDDPYYLTSDGSNIDYLTNSKICRSNAPSPPAPSYTEISSCMQISEPGEYRLVNDIIDQNVSECIGINSNDVILDCQGHLIDGVDFYVQGPPEQTSFGIHSHGYNNITVKNCRLSDWSHPFNFEYSTNVTALNIEAFSGPWIGPFFESSNNVYIENLTAYDFEADGLTLRNTTNSYVKNLEIYNCNHTGFVIDTGSNNDVVENATVYNMGITGMYVGEDCSSIILRNIAAYSNVYNGLDIRGSNHILENIETYNTSPDNPGLRINSVNTTLRNIFNHDEYSSIIDWRANNVTLEYSKCSNVNYGCWYILGNNTIIRNNDFPSGIGFFGAYSSEVYNNTLGGLEARDWNGVLPSLIRILNNTIVGTKSYFVNGTNIEIAYNEFRYTNIGVANAMYLTDSSFHDNYAYVTNDNYNSRFGVDFRIINSRNVDVYGNRLYVFNTSYVLDGYNDTWASIMLRGSCNNVSVHDNYGYAKFPNGAITGIPSYGGSVWHNNIYVYNNYMESTGVFCLQVCKGDGMYFYNNTILDGCIWAIGPVNNAYIYDNKISQFSISSINNPINNMYAYNNTIWGNKTNSPGVKIWYGDVDFKTKLVGSNIFHPETDTLTPYLSIVLNYSSIDYGTTEPFRSYDYVGGITVNTNMIDYKIEVDSTDLVSGANSISKSNLSFGFSKTLDFNYLLNPYNTITIFKQNLQDMFNILTRLYVPLVAPGTYIGNITITISQGLSDNQILNPHGGVNVQIQ